MNITSRHMQAAQSLCMPWHVTSPNAAYLRGCSEATPDCLAMPSVPGSLVGHNCRISYELVDTVCIAACFVLPPAAWPCRAQTLGLNTVRFRSFADGAPGIGSAVDRDWDQAADANKQQQGSDGLAALQPVPGILNGTMLR